jgi:hypothetical protein
MYAPKHNTASKGLRGWWASPPRSGMRRMISPGGEDVALFRHRRHPRCRVPGLGGMHFGTL